MRYHFVGTARNREIVHVTATQCRAQRVTDVLLRHTERSDLVAVDHDSCLRRIELQVNVGKVELVVGPGLVQHRLRHGVQVLEWLGRGNHELHRQTLHPRQGRQREGCHTGTGDIIPLLLQIDLHLVLVVAAVAPILEQHAAQAGIGGRHAGQLEHLLVFGDVLGNVIHLLSINLHLV